MAKSKIPIAFAITGLVIGLIFMALYFYELYYNPFHSPTMEQAQALPHGYSAPPLYDFLVALMFALVPGLLFPAIGVDGWAGVVLWVVAVLLNGPLYYCLGLAVAWALTRKAVGKIGRMKACGELKK